jgi:ribosomal protein L10
MSKPVKELMTRELVKRFDGLTSVAICNFAGVGAVRTNEIRGRLREQGIRVTVVKNSLARKAFDEVGLGLAGGLLDGPCAVVYGGESVVNVVRELLAIKKETPELTVKAAVLEGDVFPSEDEVNRLSKFPTRDEAISEVLGAVLSAGSNLAGCLTGPGGALAGILKAIEEKQGGGESAEADG